MFAMSTKPSPNLLSRMGRPSEFSDEVAAEILECLSEGLSLSTICSDERLPHRSTIFRWLAARPDFPRSYQLAKEMGCELIAETALEEALTATPQTAQLERLRWDARRWHISKLQPRKFGDRTQTEISGPGGAPLQITPVAPGDGADDAERLKRIISTGRMTADLYDALNDPDVSDAA
jgi:hypothetical protein